MQKTKEKMQTITPEVARQIVGDRPAWELRAMRKALTALEWFNTPEEARRLVAVNVLLKHSK